jgi:hypothetical protein
MVRAGVGQSFGGALLSAAAARPLASEASEAPPCGRWIRNKGLSVATPRLRVAFVGRGTAAA